MQTFISCLLTGVSCRAFVLVAVLAACFTCVVSSAGPSPAQEENSFATLEKGLVRDEEVHDQACCDRGIYSKSFDRWIQAYINGRDAEALKEWAGVLQAAKGAKSLTRLASCACTRLDFLDGADSDKLDKRGGLLPAVKAMYDSTVKLVGKDTFQAASIAHYLSDKYRGSGQYALSVLYAKEDVRSREVDRGGNDYLLWPSLMDLADKELLARDYVNCKAHTERALALGIKIHSVPAQYRCRAMLTKLKSMGVAK